MLLLIILVIFNTYLNIYSEFSNKTLSEESFTEFTDDYSEEDHEEINAIIEISTENIVDVVIKQADGTGLYAIKDCSAYMKLNYQPEFNDNSRIKKCCPYGENLHLDESKRKYCASQTMNFRVDVLVVTLYKDCIQDEEKIISLDIEEENPCSGLGFLPFNKNYNDTLYVIQNGSLLRLETNGVSFNIYNKYCLDMDASEGVLTAFVCFDEFPAVNRKIYQGQVFVFIISLVCAIPLLFITAYLYIAIPEFNDLHGKSLALNCISFAVALLLTCISQFKLQSLEQVPTTLEIYVEYFVLVTFLWLLVSCINICGNALYLLPKEIHLKEKRHMLFTNLEIETWILLPSVIICFTVPGIIILLAGSHFTKHYFFMTIYVILLFNTICFVGTYFGFREVKEIVQLYERIQTREIHKDYSEHLKNLPRLKKCDLEKLQYMSIYTAYLFMIMAVVWILAGITYYVKREIPILFNILFALQGILIFLIFICLPKPYKTVKEYFKKKDYSHTRVVDLVAAKQTEEDIQSNDAIESIALSSVEQKD